MVDMTGHRDHTMLDISVISAVQELARADQVRVLTLATVRGKIFVRPRAEIIAGEAARMVDTSYQHHPGEPIGLPGAGAVHRPPRVERRRGQRGRRAHPVAADLAGRQGRHLPGSGQPDAVHQGNHPRHRGIVSVYRNFQNLLDYSERDSLTGLLNRKTFDDQLAKMLAACTDQESVTLPGEPERAPQRRGKAVAGRGRCRPFQAR
jgi:hypothetical protein